MITTFLVDHPWVSPIVLGLLVASAPFVGRWLAPRPGLAWLLTGVSLIPVVLLTLAPVEREIFALCTVQWAFQTPGRVELLANVVLFVTPALLAGVATRRPVVVYIGASTLSAALEALQASIGARHRPIL